MQATVTKETPTLSVATILAIVVNVLSTVGLVIVNKLLYRNFHFEFMMTLTTAHFACTSLSLYVMLRRGLFVNEPRPLSVILPVAIGSIGSVAFGNLSLAYNSVGFYQLAKLVSIPLTIGVEFFMYGKRVTLITVATIVVLLFGILLTTSSDVTLNLIGTIYASLSVLFTVMAQIFTKSAQEHHGMSSFQLLYQSSPLQTLGVLALIPVFDNVMTPPNDLLGFDMQSECLALIILTCLFAVGNNASNYMVIGNTSPVTFQVIGHFKTCFILILGFIVFSYPVIPRFVLGITIAMAGVVGYGEVKRRQL